MLLLHVRCYFYVLPYIYVSSRDALRKSAACATWWPTQPSAKWVGVCERDSVNSLLHILDVKRYGDKGCICKQIFICTCIYVYMYVYITCIDLHMYFLRHVLVWNKSKKIWEESLCLNRNPHKLTIHTAGVFQERFGKTAAAEQVSLDRCRKKYYQQTQAGVRLGVY